MSGTSPPTSHRLIADCMLGRLARWLRILGADVAYDSAITDAELVERAALEDRVILTRDRRLVLRRRARRYLLILSEDLEEQLAQVIRELHLDIDVANLFGRCLLCNQPLVELAPEEAHPRVPPYVARTQRRFRQCPECGRVFWAASHVQRMLSRLTGMGIVLD